MSESTRLGESSSDPDGPRGAYAGRGEMAVVGNTIWVFDTRSDALLEVDTFEVRSFQHFEANLFDDGDPYHMAVDAGEIYVALSRFDRIVVFDGKSRGQGRSYYRGRSRPPATPGPGHRRRAPYRPGRCQW